MDFDLSLIENLSIGAVAWVPLIVGLVALAKHLNWVANENARYLAAGLSAVAYGLDRLLAIYPAYMAVVEPVANMVFISLVVAGFYQLGKTKQAEKVTPVYYTQGSDQE